MKHIASRTRILANMAMMLALMITLSALEHMIPPLPMAPPSVRLGLANVVTMYTLFFLGRSPALTLTVLKSVFILLTRGATAGITSFCGGLLSILVIMLIMLLSRGKASYLIMSVAGAIMHNFGQIIVASLMLSTNILIIYWPVLLISGVVFGTVTGTLLRVIMPFMNKTLLSKK